MLQELSLERTRLKHEQTKLERLSSSLMIDLQSSLITSDDHVIVPSPEGILQIDSDADLPISLRKPNSGTMAIDDIDITIRSRNVLTPPRSGEPSKRGQSQPLGIRATKSLSPQRTNSLVRKSPPSPPYGQSQRNATTSNLSNVNTPTRINFRTGLSGHRALTSSNSHPHDFIVENQTNHRSYSNHTGISLSGDHLSISHLSYPRHVHSTRTRIRPVAGPFGICFAETVMFGD